MALEKSWKNPENTSQYYYYCWTADLTVMDSSQRMDFDLLYSLPSVLSTCGWTVPYLSSNVGGGDCGAVVILKKSEGA